MNNISNSFPVLQINFSQNPNDFVSWSSLHNYPGYDLYKSIVSKPELEVGDLKLLFTWKNGMNLSTKKQDSFVLNILQYECLLIQLKRHFNYDLFLSRFSKLPVIWQIFLVHIIQPSIYPIFDQHLYRAFKYIKHKDNISLPNLRQEKLKAFHDDYLPFFEELKQHSYSYDFFEVDKALWTFGKLIKEYPTFINQIKCK